MTPGFDKAFQTACSSGNTDQKGTRRKELRSRSKNRRAGLDAERVVDLKGEFEVGFEV